jgi:tRNA (guanine10-N2)-methyltransferase
VPYSVPEVLTDLINFAAKSIVLGGYLVYWLPTTVEYTESEVPRHPCFSIVGNSDQPMQMRWSRRMITMEKIIEYNESAHGITKVEFVLSHGRQIQKNLNR